MHVTCTGSSLLGEWARFSASMPGAVPGGGMLSFGTVVLRASEYGRKVLVNCRHQIWALAIRPLRTVRGPMLRVSGIMMVRFESAPIDCVPQHTTILTSNGYPNLICRRP
jgi:hypothetical protein